MNSAKTRCALMITCENRMWKTSEQIVSTLKTLTWMRKIMQYCKIDKHFVESVFHGGKRVKFRKTVGQR